MEDIDMNEPPHYRISRMAKEMEARGREILHMEIGDPDLDTDKRIIDAMYRAALEGYTHYGFSQGIPELREEIANYLNMKLGVSLDKDNICLTPGGKAGIYIVLRLLKPSKMALIEPIWGLYHSFADLMDIKVLNVESRFEDGWIPLDEEIKKLDKFNVISIVNPSNPTGVILPEETLEVIVDKASSIDAYIFADELYFDLIHDNTKFTSFLNMEYEKVISVFSFSKNFAMTGFRVGYIVSPNKELISRYIKLQRLILGGVPPFIQYGALEAMRNKDIIERNRRFYVETSKYFVDGLERLGFEMIKPKAGIYVFPKVPSSIDGTRFVEKLLVEGGLAVSPGTAFGNYPDFIRFTTALKIEKLDAALKILEKVLIDL